MRSLFLCGLLLGAPALSGCGGKCAEGTKETTSPAAGWVDIGVPEGAVACESEMFPQDPYVSFKDGSEEEGVKKLVAHMESKGWKELPLPAAVQKKDAEAAVNGRDKGTTKIFGKDGTTERRYGKVYKSPPGNVVLSIYKSDCTPSPNGNLIPECT